MRLRRGKRVIDASIELAYLALLALGIQVWGGISLQIWPGLRLPLFWVGLGLLLAVAILWIRPHAKRIAKRNGKRKDTLCQ